MLVVVAFVVDVVFAVADTTAAANIYMQQSFTNIGVTVANLDDDALLFQDMNRLASNLQPSTMAADVCVVIVSLMIFDVLVREEKRAS